MAKSGFCIQVRWIEKLEKNPPPSFPWGLLGETDTFEVMGLDQCHGAEEGGK